MTESKNHTFNIDLGGDIVVSEAVINIYGITSSNPELIDSRVVTTSTFTVQVPVDDTGFFYVVAEIRRFLLDGGEVDTGDRTFQLISTFTSASDTIALGERLTVATTYCFARFLQVDAEGTATIAGPDRALRVASLMKDNFMASDGTLSKVIQTSPNGLETNSYAMLNFLSNLLYYCLATPAVYTDFTYLLEAGSSLEALLSLARDPFTDPMVIYSLISERTQVYSPSLPSLESPASPLPDQWTLTIKVNNSGSENFLIAGVGYVVFDKNDRAWLTNNVRQGTPNSSTFCVILEPDGSISSPSTGV